MNSSAVMLGGPNHGKRYGTLPDHGNTLNMIAPQNIWDMYKLSEVGPTYPTLDVVSCDIFSLAVGQHTIKAVRWPDIKQDTAKRLLADYVLAAWEQYDITHCGDNHRRY